ncbi:hypothetical protein [uncultured Paracoccus sp.]|uniref:hypothetical protein n=1 Tax=uncultured Paracoccus sp. TaxID=189685 RepID=UPI002632873E|nr:hypothetical protein [uncultured Paracoccus sp.]
MTPAHRKMAARFGLAFSVADAGMTAGFGFLAYTAIAAKVMFAGVYGLMSLCLALVIPIAIAWSLNEGRRTTAALLGILLALGSIINQVTNVGFTSTMMGSEIHGNRITNNRAAIASDTLGILKDRHDKITSELEKLVGLEPPAAYEARILKLKSETEGGRNIFARSKGCTDTTLKTSQMVCQGIAEATRTAENARRKVALETELAGLLPKLAKASDKSEEKQEEFSPIVAQMRTVSTMWTLSLAPDKDSQDWTVLWFSLFLSLLISALAIACNIIGATRSAEDARIIDGGTITPTHRMIASDTPAERGSFERETVTVTTRNGTRGTYDAGHASDLARAGAIDASEIQRATAALRQRTARLRELLAEA